MELRQEFVAVAHQRRRWGYRMIHDVLRPKYPNINHNRVYRPYTAEGLFIRKRKKKTILAYVCRWWQLKLSTGLEPYHGASSA